MCKTELDILEEQVRQKRIDMLIEKGLIKPVMSFEEYASTIQKVKKEASYRLFTNSYMMRMDVERLINLNLLYHLSISNGIAFVEDQQGYWRLHLHIDLEKKLAIPKLDKSILIESVYVEGKMTKQQAEFERILHKEDFSHFYETYRAFRSFDKMTKEEYDRYYRTVWKALEKESVHICVPNDKQLHQFERIYRERIDLYTQTFYTFDERKEQRDRGLIKVLVDKNGEVIALSLDSMIGGGAIAVRSDYASSIYITAFFLEGLKGRYRDETKLVKQPSKPERPGWIATRNVVSQRTHEMFGIKYTGRAFNQYIVPGYMC